MSSSTKKEVLIFKSLPVGRSTCPAPPPQVAPTLKSNTWTINKNDNRGWDNDKSLYDSKATDELD
eukprot:12003492-Prorocentrum_lima.AAC.1